MVFTIAMQINLELTLTIQFLLQPNAQRSVGYARYDPNITIVVEPPGVHYLTDEDSADEEDADLNRLSGNQLRAPAIITSNFFIFIWIIYLLQFLCYKNWNKMDTMVQVLHELTDSANRVFWETQKTLSEAREDLLEVCKPPALSR